MLPSACNLAPAIPPTVDQAALGTIVASTQTAIAKILPTITPTHTVQPTEPAPTPVPATPTMPPPPTTMPGPIAQIAYINSGNVRLWTEGTGSISLTDTGDAVNLALSSDSQLVAYVRQDPKNPLSQELWVVNTSGIPAAKILVSSMELAELVPVGPDYSPSGIGVLDLVWHLNTHDLYYDTYLLHEGPGFSPIHDLRLVNAESLAKTTLLDKGEGGLFYFSPDGNQIALSSPDSISLVNADGSNLRRNVLTFPYVITYSEYYYHPHPIWAADSSSLRVTIPPEDPLADPLPATGLWLIPTDGSPAVLLGNVYAIPFAWPNNAFSPDFKHVIYAMSVGEPAENLNELHIANPDGSNDVVYDKGESLIFMVWSPDSQHFIYMITGGEGEGLYVGAVGEQPTFLYSDPYLVMNIRWLDDARFVYFLTNGDQLELRMMSLSGDNLAFIDTVSNTSAIFDAILK